MPLTLPPHRLKVALIRPQIAPNTGNIARLCVATGTELHLVRPLGFFLSDRGLRRSAMDYWPRLKLTVHDDEPAFWKAVGAECGETGGETPPLPVGAGFPRPSEIGAGGETPPHPVGATGRFWLLSSKGTIGLWDALFADGDWLIFGNETQGLSESLLTAHPDRAVRIPQSAGERCLNLSTAAGIALYEALRHIGRKTG